jgi:hypothetical protein
LNQFFQIEDSPCHFFALSKLIHFKDQRCLKEFLKVKHKINGSWIYSTEFKGIETLKNISKKVEKKCLFLSGIQMTTKIETLRGFLSRQFKFNYLFVPRMGERTNKHFGFICFETEEDKNHALELRKFKLKKKKLVLKDFDVFSLFDQSRMKEEKRNRNELRGSIKMTNREISTKNELRNRNHKKIVSKKNEAKNYSQTIKKIENRKKGIKLGAFDDCIIDQRPLNLIRRMSKGRCFRLNTISSTNIRINAINESEQKNHRSSLSRYAIDGFSTRNMMNSLPRKSYWLNC